MTAKVKIEYDPDIMNDLLAEPEIAENIAQMEPQELELFRQLLVVQGTYKRYVWYLQKKQVMEDVKKNFPGLAKKAREIRER